MQADKIVKEIIDLLKSIVTAEKRQQTNNEMEKVPLVAYSYYAEDE